MINPFNLTYPPLARQANIIGDVKLQLEIRKDGSIPSAAVVSGHPVLTQAALNSAQRSHFACRGCEDAVTTGSFTYSFQIAASPGWPYAETNGARVSRAATSEVGAAAVPGLCSHSGGNSASNKRASNWAYATEPCSCT
jgi:Gram-negative bacterial TonB protein C-terminal